MARVLALIGPVTFALIGLRLVIVWVLRIEKTMRRTNGRVNGRANGSLFILAVNLAILEEKTCFLFVAPFDEEISWFEISSTNFCHSLFAFFPLFALIL